MSLKELGQLSLVSKSCNIEQKKNDSSTMAKCKSLGYFTDIAPHFTTRTQSRKVLVLSGRAGLRRSRLRFSLSYTKKQPHH